MLACFSVAAFSQSRAEYELPDRDKIQREAESLLERIQQTEVKLERDANGRVTRITNGAVASDVLYDVNGKVDGYVIGGRTMIVRAAINANRDPVLRFFEADGVELQPVDLKRAGVSSSMAALIADTSIFPSADMIDVRQFAAIEKQRMLEKSASRLSVAGQISRAKVGTLDDDPKYKPALCILRCDSERDKGLNQCDAMADMNNAACVAGGALLAETGIPAIIYTAACLIYSAGVKSSCKNNVLDKHFSCASQCN